MSESNVIEDDDFIAKFMDNKWVVSWKWSSEERPVSNKAIGEYEVAKELREKYDCEIEEWIKNGWL